MELEGKIALVTGSARRLGKAIALALAERGCRLMVHYHRSALEAKETLAELEALGVEAAVAAADLSSHAGVRSLFRAVDEAFDGLDVLVNSAANMLAVDLLEAAEADWDRSLGLNLKGAFFCLQQAAIRMRARGAGSIVNISDIAGLRPWPRYPIHSISKAGLEMLTKVAARALAPEIRVNAIAPGPVLRPSWLDDDRWRKITAALPLKRGGGPKNVTDAVVFLLENDFITGETVVVDGGRQLV